MSSQPHDDDEQTLEFKTRDALVAELTKHLKHVQDHIAANLMASKQQPIDRAAHLIQARESLVFALLSINSSLAVALAQLTQVLDRLPFRERISRDATGNSLLILKAIQDAILFSLRG